MIQASNVSKTLSIKLKLKLYGKRLYLTKKTKYLGLVIDENLNWKFHLEQLAVKLRKVNGILSKLRHFLTTVTLKSIYYALFLLKSYLWSSGLGPRLKQ